MNIPQPNQPGYTLEDWAGWEGRWELINGIAYDMTPAPSTRHQRVSVSLETAIQEGLKDLRMKGRHHGCELLHAPLDVFLPSGVFEPDIVVICDPARISTRGIEGPPDLVVEILSPRTASKDLTRKRWAYELAGIPEYLIVDPDERHALLLRMEGKRYEEFRIEWGGLVELLGGSLRVPLA